MREIDPTYEYGEAVDADSPPSLSSRTLRRLLYLAFAALTILLLVVLPPLISVNRYQKRIANSIGDSLGRPVHLDKVSLNLLPLPGFTLENFVVDEDPAFGSEPVIRANSVRATLRFSSLWRRRVEFSTISFTDPSVNLVHLANGKWNLESILLHAAHIDAAPTAQKRAGSAPRFPYIEATSARVNLKFDQEKTPFSLADADFALWLPDPRQWHLRIQARPTRTDTNASDTGTLQVEGTLGRAASLGQVPISLRGEWRNVPLGQASLVVFGRDAGLRGDMILSANAQGTVSNSAIQTRLQLTGARRADFVPVRPLDVDLQCLGTATGDFHSFQDIHCSWPPAGSSGPPTLAISGAVPDIRNPSSAAIEIGTPGLPAATLLDWLHVASSRVPSNLSVSGTLTGSLSYRPDPATSTPWQGEMLLTNAGLINEGFPGFGAASLVTGDVTLQSVTPPPPDPRRKKQPPARQPPAPAPPGFQLAPTALALGGKDPAILEGHFDTAGYTLHLTGMASIVRLHALAASLPPFGDGLAEVLPANRAAGAFRIDLTATRRWGAPQTWTDNTVRLTPPHLRRVSRF
jgi:AsmA protein